MKKIIILFPLICLFCSNSFSQLTLTSAYNPIPGDIGKYFYCDTAGIMPGDSGLNKIWNFTNLQVNDSIITYYIAPDTTPYFSSFSSANISSYNEGQVPVVYSYYKTSTSMFEYLGYAYTDVLYVLSNTQIIMQYPFTYNNTFTDTYSGSGILSGISFNVSGTVINSGDATGTITLPFGTYPNAFRIKTIQSETDSAIGYPYVLSVSSVEYSWYVSSLKFPLFIIYYYTSIDNGDTSTSKQVSYSHNQLIGIVKNSESIPKSFSLSQNYPNPFNPVTKIRFSLPFPSRRVESSTEGGVKLVVYDLLGRQIVSLIPSLRGGQEGLKPGTYEVEWDATDYPSGVYFYKLISGEFTETKKMVLLK